MKAARVRVRSMGGAALVLGALSVLPACGSPPALAKPPQAAATQKVEPTLVTDSTFAREAAALLGSGEITADRPNRLGGVVRYQLARAGKLLAEGHDDAGLEALEGALYLIRAGELHPSMIERSTDTLALGAAAVARKGAEGRALALYSMLDRVLPGGELRTEVEAHLAAIQRWEEGTRNGNALQAAGAAERIAVDRALWDPGPETLRAARAATIDWIEQAIGYSREQGAPTMEQRDIAIEAYRAIRTGAMVLSALYLRHGDPAGALEAMDQPQVARVVSPHLHDALRRAAEDSDPEAWFELFSTFDRLSASEDEVSLDPELGQAAAWGAALALHRAEPGTMRGAMPLATLLLRHGMSEVGPLVMSLAVQDPARVESASWAVGYLMQAILSHDAVGDVGAARRTFEQGLPILAFVEKQAFRDGVSPSVARLRFVMGGLLARSGELALARPLVEASMEKEPLQQGFELLAAIDRQAGDTDRALASLERVTRLATEASDPASVAVAALTTFELRRDRGEADAAAKALETALLRVLDARTLARTLADQATAERTLARVLAAYGDVDGARRATHRAFDASRNDVRQLTATALESARRSLVQGDLKSAREATRQAVAGNVAGDDLVYVALWLRLLERKLGTPTDGTVEDAFARVDRDDGWPARLRAWATGRLSDEALEAAARSRAEQTEAAFYTAMAAYVAHGTRSIERLAKVATSTSIDLVEVSIARDLAASGKPLALKPPAGVEIP